MSPSRLPVQWLDEQANDPAARQADGERLVVAVAEGDDPRLGLARQHGECLGGHGPLHAPATHAAGDLTTLADRHRRPWSAWTGPLDVDDPRHGDPLALRLPAVDVVEDLT